MPSSAREISLELKPLPHPPPLIADRTILRIKRSSLFIIRDAGAISRRRSFTSYQPLAVKNDGYLFFPGI